MGKEDERGASGAFVQFPAKKLFHSKNTIRKRGEALQKFLAALLRIPNILEHKEVMHASGEREGE